MTDPISVIRLQSWLSPAFPTGAFSYSHGLEAAIAKDWIKSQQELSQWLLSLVESGPGWNDAVLLAQSWQAFADEAELAELAQLASALCFSKERLVETTAQGGAFLRAASAWGEMPKLAENCPLPIAVGACSGQVKIDLTATIAAYLHAYVSNQVQAALRLMKLGQQGGVELLAQLEQPILDVASAAAKSTLDDLGSSTVMADVAAINHETLSGRMFIS